jgi:NAD(P)-dependent dehydrogenase (short-subunit alcohol dehydrogenase family)
MAQDVAVVCGATGALGSAVVEAFLRRDARVVAVGSSADAVDALRARGEERLRAERTDLRQPEDVAALWDRLESDGDLPRYLVNVAGGYGADSVAETELDHFRFIFELNLSTAWWSCREAARRMNGGAIVNVGSRSAVTGGAGEAAYAVSKAAVVRLSQVLAEELKAAGVRVNVVIPNVMDTAANRASMPAKVMERSVPPEDVARVISFLCSEESWPITGAAIPVYGRA